MLDSHYFLLTMNAHKIFLITTNCMGINFGELSISPKIIIAVSILTHIWEIFIIIIFPFFLERETLSHFVFVTIAYFQEQVPYFIQILILFRAFQMRELQSKLSRCLKVKFTQQLYRNEKRFLWRVLLIIVVRIVKFSMGQKRSYLFYNTRVTIFEIINTSNDLMFVYYVEMLSEYLEYIDLKIQMMRSHGSFFQIQRDLINVFWLKRDVEKRYSMDLFLTISYNFILNIISFYWVMARIIFNHLKTFSGLATFLHFIIPFYTFWILFSTCEKFTKKVNLFLRK